MTEFPRRESVDWYRSVDRDVALDVFEVRAATTRTWSFVWPGRVVAERRGVGEDAPQTTVALVDRTVATLVVRARPGDTLRVMFEHTGGPQPFEWMSPHVMRASFDGAPSPIDAFQAAVTAFEEKRAAGLAGGRLVGPMARARLFIEAHVHEDFDLAAVSKIAGVERCHLCRHFRKLVGLPPRRFRSHLRVARARKLLVEGVDCAGIAQATGFCDQSHLSRWFKEVTGTTPRAYATACRVLDAQTTSTAA